MALTINTIGSKVFNLKKGEEKVVMLLTAYSFFMGLAYAYFYTASTSLFVGKFDISVLPYAYMGQGVVSYIVWLFFKRLQRYISFSKLFIAGGVFLLISVCGLSYEYLHNESKASAFALFVWYNIFLLLNGIGFWGIAAKIFNLGQAKRLFGLIGSGEILARVISFLSVPLLLKVIKTSDLFYLSMAGLIVCLPIMPLITRHLKEKTSPGVPHQHHPDGKEQTESNTGIFKNRYFLLIFLLALFPLFATFYVDFIFLGQVKLQFVNAKVISGFISIFMGSMSVAEFILKTFVSGRVLTKYSLLFSILLLPILLAFSTLLAATLGTFYGTAGLFFSFIILSRLFVRVVRTLFFDTSFQILYQPVAVEQRLALQSKVEGVSKSIGFIFAGGMLVLLAKAKSIDVVMYNYIFLVIIALWIWVSYKLYNEYKHLLKSVIGRLSGYKADEEKKQAKAASRYMNMIDAHDVHKSGIAFNVLEKVVPTAFNLMMLRLLPKSNALMQQVILQKLWKGNVTIAIPVLDFCLKNNHVNGLTKLFEEVRDYLNTVQKTDYESAVNLSSSNKIPDRLAMAHLMAYYQNYNSYKILLKLLHDDVWPVRNAALMSSGNIKKRELWPLMVQSLLEDETAYSATYAIKHVGDALLPYLAALLNRVDLPKNSYIRVIKTIADIDSPKVESVLISHLKLVEPDIRNNIFTALYNRHYKFAIKEHHAIKEHIENEIEIIVWIAAAIVDIEQADEAQALKTSLELELRYKIGFSFKLLSMMYDANVIRFFINSFENSSLESRAYAMEVLNMTIPADLKKIIMPLLNDLSFTELVQAYSTNYAQQRLSVQERLIDIINKDYTKINYWTKAMAVNLLATFPGSDEVLAGQMLSRNKLYCETVLWKLHNNNPYVISAMSDRLTAADKERIFERTKRFKNINYKRYLLTDVVDLFKQHPFFKNLPMFELMNLCELIKQQYLAAGGSIALTDENDKEAAYFIMNGHLRISGDFGENDIYNTQMYWYVQDGPSSQLTINAVVNTAYIRISASTLYELLANNPIRIKKMINTLSAVSVKEAVL